MSGKTFVLDTNVLIHDPEAYLKFGDNEVIITLGVIEDLDRMKKDREEVGKSSRQVIRSLDTLCQQYHSDLSAGIHIKNGPTVRVELQISSSGSMSTDRRLKVFGGALFLKEKGRRVIFVSKDFAARIKAKSLGLEAEDYENLKESYDNLYRGMRTLELPKRDIDLFMKDGMLPAPADDFAPNEYCIMTSQEQSTAIGKYDAKTKRLTALLKPLNNIWGLVPLNTEQKCALDLLLRDDIKLVSLMGQAGTGKTLLALAAGMRKVFDEGVYHKILISRPIVPLGKDIGYLPGAKEEKLYHWMQPIYDNLEFLCSSDNEPGATLQWVNESKKIEMEAVTYIRGRSLPKVYLMIDEAQNLTPHEMKTIISRAGAGTKVVLTGDPTQIDNPYLDKDSNGLTLTVARFKNFDIFGHMFLTHTERSKLAAIAADIM